MYSTGTNCSLYFCLVVQKFPTDKVRIIKRMSLGRIKFQPRDVSTYRRRSGGRRNRSVCEDGVQQHHTHGLFHDDTPPLQCCCSSLLLHLSYSKLKRQNPKLKKRTSAVIRSNIRSCNRLTKDNQSQQCRYSLHALNAEHGQKRTHYNTAHLYYTTLKNFSGQEIKYNSGARFE